MSDDCTLEDVKAFATQLSPWAHIATVGSDGEPDVVPVHPCWEGDTLWTMLGTTSVKAKNVADNPKLALHWQVTENGDGVEVWGTGEVFTDLETKRRLWDGVFDYDLNAFAPGGPDSSPDTAFLAITPSRALILKQYGMGGLQRWSA
ncbi:pyridoxamine 5'-phosphate oxidase family protein [Ilumatobacter nonamiensis]|uniref:pyridoxamine 5'-phosphate oxidase family protein n=1 Tax=Ilumatobacter nonamiensis TaxID=467093 RepID=UPI0003496BBB|nr:pyridoxamine 5'-phosphate oxidase family protein [Ilumatobacter nonamiensis]